MASPKPAFFVCKDILISLPPHGFPSFPGVLIALYHILHQDSMKKACCECNRLYLESGGDLLSRAVTSQVPSALKGLTSVFGMGTGVTPSSLPPEMVSCLRKPFSFLYCVSVSPGLPVFLFFLLQARRCFHTLTTAQYRFS